jgi:hypothetical protein
MKKLHSIEVQELNELINLFLQATLKQDFEEMSQWNIQLTNKLIIIDNMLS